MTDYIERDRLMSEIEKSVEAAVQDGNLVVADAFETMRDLVYAFPAADVRPVVRSKWKLLTNGDGICQRCGSLQKHIWDADGWQNFCGHCGADMRQAEKDDLEDIVATCNTYKSDIGGNGFLDAIMEDAKKLLKHRTEARE